MNQDEQAISIGSQKEVDEFNPLDLIKQAGKNPSFSFTWESPGKKQGEDIPRKRMKKRRLICRPNGTMRVLHNIFQIHLEKRIDAMGKKDTYALRNFPSATGCVPGSNALLNAKKHEKSEYFYITDFKHAYQSVDLRRLALLLVFIEKYDEYRIDYDFARFGQNELAQYAVSCDPLFPKMESFVKFAFGGYAAIGLAIGGVLSPYLLNLYCEVYLDMRIRYYIMKMEDTRNRENNLIYTRFVDDLVFSRGRPITNEMRSNLRRMIEVAGFSVNHRKSFVQKRSRGTVFVTKTGLRVEPHAQPKEGDWDKRETSILTFSQEKRCRLSGILQSYVKTIPKKLGDKSTVGSHWNDSPEVITGMMAEFIYYYKKVAVPTESDKKLMALYQKFKVEAEPYLKKMNWARAKRTQKMERT